MYLIILNKNKKSRFKAYEEKYIINNIDLTIEKRKMKVGMWSKFTNPFKSDYKMTKKSGNRSYQKERMILKYKMVDYDLVYKIARIKVIIDKYILAVEKKIIN